MLQYCIVFGDTVRNALDNVADWLYEKVTQLMLVVMAIFEGHFTPDLSDFKSVFAYVSIADKVIRNIAYTFAILILVWAVASGIIGIVTDVWENPIKIVVRFAIAMLLITYSAPLLDAVLDVGNGFYTQLKQEQGETQHMSRYEYLYEALSINPDYLYPGTENGATMYYYIKSPSESDLNPFIKYITSTRNLIVNKESGVKDEIKNDNKNCPDVTLNETTIESYFSVIFNSTLMDDEDGDGISVMQLQLTMQKSLTGGDVVSAVERSGIQDSSIIIKILQIIIWCLMLTNFLKLMMVVAERYILTGVLYYLSPIAIATYTSKATEQICSRFFQMFITQILILILNLWFVQTAFYALGSATGDFSIIWLLMVLSFLITGQKIDEHINTLGGIAGRAGTGLSFTVYTTMRTISGAYRGVRMTGQDMARSVGKVGHGISNISKSISNNVRGAANRAQRATQIDRHAGNGIHFGRNSIRPDGSVSERDASRAYNNSLSGMYMHTKKQDVADASTARMLAPLLSDPNRELVKGSSVYNGSYGSAEIRNKATGDVTKVSFCDSQKYQPPENGKAPDTTSIYENLTGENHQMTVSYDSGPSLGYYNDMVDKSSNSESVSLNEYAQKTGVNFDMLRDSVDQTSLKNNDIYLQKYGDNYYAYDKFNDKYFEYQINPASKSVSKVHEMPGHFKPELKVEEQKANMNHRS